MTTTTENPPSPTSSILLSNMEEVSSVSSSSSSIGGEQPVHKRRRQAKRSSSVRFTTFVEIAEFSLYPEEKSKELYYNSEDYDRFQIQEKARWERAIKKKLQKLRASKASGQLEDSSVASVGTSDGASIASTNSNDTRDYSSSQSARSKRPDFRTSEAA
eukprot:CAMPEP_0194027960 /NCGR_PEP_ID=MMETSP0009_2-20130614/1988_1 /TAXON_ID=210454 /ORGANISM="Grammatophora oceanica, Strain CCMP 410" /LENGTH=158 /DNA_ID=CAMNT_0038667173 /DNA_START=100 /DNA_END=576 /DNA_ORIENTATION=+